MVSPGERNSMTSSSTMKSAAVGAGIAVLMLLVGAMSYTMTRDDDSAVDSASSNVEAGTEFAEDESSSSSPLGTPVPLDATSTTTTTEVPEREFAELFEELRPAVASVTAVACDTTRQGTAFLVSDDIVYTAASVVAESAEIAVTIGETSVEAVVLGQDPERNIAALRLGEPVTGITPLTLSKKPPRVGSEVGAIVRPIALPITLTVGRLASIDTSFPAALLRTDADAELGGSGGPMIDQRGEVVGIVSLGVDDDGDVSTPLGAVAAIDVQEQLAGWVAEPVARPVAFCVGNVDLSQIDAVAGELIAADTDHPEIQALQRTYAIYSQSINSSRAENAYDVLGPAITNSGDRTAWADGQRTSKLWDWRIREVADSSTGLQVRSVFTSTQDSEFGFDGASTCTRWDITYDMVRGTFRGEDYWLINRSRATEGSGPVDCDEWLPELVEREELVAAEVPGQLRRTDRLAGGTVHAWDFGIGVDSEDGAGPTPQTLTVRVGEVSGFDPVVEVRSETGSLLAANDDAEEGSVNSEVSITVTTAEVLSVRVRDSSNRAGGEYSITFESSEG